VYLSVRHLTLQLLKVKKIIGLHLERKYLTPLKFYHRSFTRICSLEVGHFLLLHFLHLKNVLFVIIPYSPQRIKVIFSNPT